LLAGVDSCRKGWLAVLGEFSGDRFLFEEVRLYPSFPSLLRASCRLIAVDLPIGLPKEYVPGGRLCDRLARKILGPRAVSVFNPPPRTICGARSYEEARARLKGHLSRQAWNIWPRIQEVDLALRPQDQDRVFETHPELVFCELAGGPLPSKHQVEGLKRRLALLQRSGLFCQLERNFQQIPKTLQKDLLDAYAALLAAKRIFTGEAKRLPAEPEYDERGLRMEIWY